MLQLYITWYILSHNTPSPYRRDDRQGKQGHIGVRTLLVDETRERGLMNPATNK
jgi:hypothetical protein